MTERARVFLDASVLLAAAGSPTGGSSAAIALVSTSEQYEAVSSAEVLRETIGNLRLKFDQPAMIRFYSLLSELRPTLAATSQSVMPPDLPASVVEKDHHVIRACLAADVSICLSLDRRHLLNEEIRRWGMQRGLRFLTPGEFLAWVRLRGEMADNV